MRAAPAPIYRLGPAAMNEFSYLPVRVITVVDMRLLETLRGPAWIVVPSDAADDLLAKRQGALHFVMAFGRPERWRLLRLDD